MRIQKFTFTTSEGSFLLIFFASAAFLALGMNREVAVFDEGITLTGTICVMAGEVPHRDFYTLYGPAQFTVLAALFKVFGPSILVERIYDLLVRALTVAVIYRLCAQVSRFWIAAVVAAVVALWMFVLKTYGYAIFPIIPLSLLGTSWVAAFLQTKKNDWRLPAAGAATGLIALFRYDIGFFAFVSHVSSLYLWIGWRDGFHRRQAGAFIRALAWYACATALVFLPVAGAYLAVAPLGPFLHDIFSYSVHYYSRMRRLPFPRIIDCLRSPDLSIVYLPVVSCAAALYQLVKARRRDDDTARDARQCSLLLWSSLAAFFFVKGVVRVSAIHMFVSLVPSLIILAVLGEIALRQKGWLRPLVTGLAAWTLFATLQGVRLEASHLRHFRNAIAFEIFPFLNRLGSPPANNGEEVSERLPRTTYFTLGSDCARAVHYLLDHTNADERILVGTGHTDKLHANDVVLYFASGRLPATHWYEFDPGLQTRADIQAEIITELEAGAVRYVVLDAVWDEVIEPNESARSSGVHLLDDYLREHYRAEATFGTITVLLRATPSPP